MLARPIDTICSSLLYLSYFSATVSYLFLQAISAREIAEEARAYDWLLRLQVVVIITS